MANEDNVDENPNQLTSEDLENIKKDEGRGFFSKAVDVVAEVVSNNATVIRVVAGVVSAVVGGVLAGPAAIGAGVAGAIIAEGGVELAQKRHEGTLRRRDSIEKKKRLDAAEIFGKENKHEQVKDKGVLQNEQSKYSDVRDVANSPGMGPVPLEVSILSGRQKQATPAA